jgi:hypothetical protein
MLVRGMFFLSPRTVSNLHRGRVHTIRSAPRQDHVPAYGIGFRADRGKQAASHQHKREKEMNDMSHTTAALIALGEEVQLRNSGKPHNPHVIRNLEAFLPG